MTGENPMTRRILIVEDDPADSRSFSLFLRHKEYTVDCAGDGLEGLDRVKEKPYDLVVSDVMMPKMNGLQFLEAVKEIKPALPIIMITGYTDLNTAIEAMKKGAVDFVTKPFRYDLLEQTIATLLGGDAGLVGPLAAADLQARLERKIHELSVLYSISEAMEVSANIDEIFRALAELAGKITEATRAAFFIYDRDDHAFYLKNSYTTIAGENRPAFFHFPQRLVEELEVGRVPMVWNPGDDLTFYAGAGSGTQPVRSLVLSPLFVRGENFGVLGVEDKSGGGEFTPTDVNFVKFLLKKASLQIENSALYETIYANLVDTLRSLVTTIEAKDPYTQRHSDRVTKIAMILAREVGCTKEELDILQFAGMLHDIGKIGISDAILQKKERLTDEEYEIIKQHPTIGSRILEPLGMLPHEKAIIRHHHERWDGGGYPDGMAGRDIPFLARIVSLADAYDAMTSERVYRKGLTHEVAMQEIQRHAGRQFDANLVKAFESICERYKDRIVALLG
jgi:putative nucleotidyltransferase with HDIG domain